MLRLPIAFGALVLAITLLSPTLASVHEAVESLERRADIPWELWKWDTEVMPPPPLACGDDRTRTESAITEWPERIEKDQPFQLGGHVIAPDQGGAGVGAMLVDVFLNETKEAPGTFLGTATTDGEGRFTLDATIPFELQAARYHLVAHAYDARECARYEEHWSDPEMDVESDTNLTLVVPERVLVGETLRIEGLLLDEVGAPVRAQVVRLSAGDEAVRVTTDDEGRFVWEGKAFQPGDHEVTASFEGTSHYDPSSARAPLRIVGEDVLIDGADEDDQIHVERSRTTTLRGEILLPDDEREPQATLVFDGLTVRACPDCPPTDTLPLQVTDEGRFEATFVVPTETDLGRYGLRVEGGGLDETHAFALHVRAPVTLELDVEGAGLFEPRYEGRVRALDDRGEPLTGEVALQGPTGWSTLPLGPQGVATFSDSAPCGQQVARVIFNGTEEHAPADATRNVIVCPAGAFMAPFGLPWWAWLLGTAAVVGGLLLARTWWRTRAPELHMGPPLTLRFAAPDDEAPGIVGVGEPVEVAARLEAPLPDGHTLRIGTAGDMKDVPLDGLEARRAVTPANLGTLAVRAEIVDAKGRARSRRTLVVRAVRYAQEIEERFRALKREGLGARADLMSPREFEAWLRTHADDLDPEVVQRLVILFEEADYSSRDITRRELLGFLTAERRLQGVKRPAPR